MGAAQLTYSSDPGALTAGAIAFADDIVAGPLKNTTGALVPFGLGVVKGSGDLNFALPASKSNKFQGVVIQRQFGNNSSLTVPQGSPGVADTDIATIGSQGVFVVPVEGAVTKGGDVFVRFATSANDGTLTQKGKFRADADTNTSVDTAAKVAGAKFLSSTSGAGNALVSFYGQLGDLT